MKKFNILYELAYQVALSTGKVYFRGLAITFTGGNIIDFYKNGYEEGTRNMHGKFVLSAGWPVTLPLIALLGSTSENERPKSYGLIGLWAALLLL